MTGESLHLSPDLRYPLLELLSLGQSLKEVLQKSLRVQAPLDLQGQLDTWGGASQHHSESHMKLN